MMMKVHQVQEKKMNKTYYLISSLAPKSESLKPLIKKELNKKLVEVDDPTVAEYLFINGGDGTFIKNAIKYDRAGLKIIGINGGSLGFYTTFNETNIDQIANNLDQLKYTQLDFIRLQIDDQIHHALNEFNINSTTAYGYDIFIDNEFYQKFRGAGLLISTTTGSTGINKSANGAILFPRIKAIQMVELYPLLHSSFTTIQSPIILPIDTKIRIEIKENYCDHDACPRIVADGAVIRQGLSSTRIEISATRSQADYVATTDLRSYIQRLQKTFIY
ncbi:NAD(+) kinase [Mycoplasmoides gallisepticum]|uniref:NAD kinase n=1 Tax=Mycoplasmoides gallisepticum TaxID=2096 RepID=A0AB36DUA2_MYCGL|nr:NAD(+) kinase [Mycoplasmoides gallisepticum]OBU78944.1 NAD(+) kinase [Mycoplasmoides gallisepticum]OBU79291.1 NAD(+) kinase [Mycoplasmoides gallisepticum]OBU79755.1 NAD(+) kinase [Mycoplasmoides gallisepticum]OBU80869.1 NAD(+) kinase [Mycoplasmoides gallisepticum]OBU81322.1 NAD(+) kinase [Mycoplasmoides gallisepticum]